jgi:nucleotide-binding universal stress UspA family protein
MNLTYTSALEDFQKARRQAALQEVVARLTGRPASLLSYQEVYRQLKLAGRAERGVLEIPVEAIVGSVGRYSDFTRTFLPRRESDESRWAGIMAIAQERGLDSLPPIEVYQIGQVYFVQDGNHRVSVARQLGIPRIQARVIELRTRVPLTPDVGPDDLIVRAQHAEFLERTRLDEIRPQADLSMTVPGGYARLAQQIEACRQCLAAEASGEAGRAEAARRWYDDVYLPVVEAIHQRGLGAEFPERTETDLYLWIDEHRADLQEALGLEVTPDAAAAAFAAGARPAPGRILRQTLDAVLPEDLATGSPPGEWREAKISSRYSGRLFNTLLVPLSGEVACWRALDQALALARLEEARLLGLHVVASEADRRADQARAVQQEFDRRLAAAGVPGQLAVEAGPEGPARKIAERALLADLVVLSLQHPPQAFRLGSGFRAVLQRSARPVLAVPEASLPYNRGLLAFDGSQRAREALFVATYLAEAHGTQLTVLTVAEDQREGEATLDEARKYLDVHEVPATCLRRAGPVETRLVETAQELQPDLLLMGGYGLHPALEVVIGSAVDHVLRHWRGPTLICR